MKQLIWLWRNEKGESNAIAIPLLVLIISIFIYMGVDLYGYMVTRSKVTSVLHETMDIMKHENEFNEVVKARFRQLAMNMGLDLNTIEITGSPTQVIQRGGTLELKLKTSYETRALKPFTGESIRLDIHASHVGTAQKYMREE